MSTTDNSTPLATAKSFLACIKARRTDDMQALCHPDATACLIRDSKPIYIRVADIVSKIAEIAEAGEGVKDEVSYDEVEHVDGDFATVWTPYRFFEDEELHHTGSNNFSLWKSPEAGWVITAVQDVAREYEGATRSPFAGFGRQ